MSFLVIVSDEFVLIRRRLGRHQQRVPFPFVRVCEFPATAVDTASESSKAIEMQKTQNN
jgi:hypothetical protein